jgi:hypothetical protein
LWVVVIADYIKVSRPLLSSRGFECPTPESATTRLVTVVTVGAPLVKEEVAVRSLVVDNLAAGELPIAIGTARAGGCGGMANDLCFCSLHVPGSILGIDAVSLLVRTKFEGPLGGKSSQVDGLGRSFPLHDSGGASIENELFFNVPVSSGTLKSARVIGKAYSGSCGRIDRIGKLL